MLLRFWKPLIIGVFIYILCLMPSSEIQKIDFIKFRYTDLVVHLLMFLIFSAILLRDLRSYYNGKKRVHAPVVVTVLLCILLGITTEIFQFLLVSLNRTGNLTDLLFDGVGSAMGILFVFLTTKRSGLAS